MRVTPALALLLLAACARPPDGPGREWLEAPRPAGPYPALLTRPELARALGAPPPAPVQGDVSERAAALRARAAALSGAVLTEAERTRLSETVRRP